MPSTSPSARYVRRTVETVTQRPGAMSQLLRLGTPVALSAMLGAAPAMAASFIAADAWIASNDRSQVTSGASLETLGGTAVTFTSTPDNANFGSSMTSGELRGALTCSTSICGASGLSGAFRSRTPVGGRNIEAITFTLDTPKVINGETVRYVVVAINNASAYATGNQVSYSANAGAIAGELDTALAALRGDETDPLITGPSGREGDATSAKTINEGSTTVATFSANEDVTWAIDSGADRARFTIDPSTGLLSFTAAPDYESPNDLGDTANNNTYVVVIKATDLAGNVATQTVTVTVADLDDSLPIITGPDGDGTTTGPNANITLPEGGRTVTTFTASELVEWSISGTDAGRFSIDPATGALTFNAASDYENPLDDNADNVYTLVVSALDSDDNVTTQTLTVTITDVDDTAPVITGPNGNTGTTAGITINEGTTAVTTYASNDATATWSITGGADAALFSIDPDTGALTFINAPDYETPNDQGATAGNNTYVVRVAATDRRNNSDSQTLTVTIADLDEDGPVITGPDGDGTTTGENANITLDEGGTAVTAFAANEDVTWSISGTDADAFTIDPATGVLVFRARTDYEAPVDGDGNNVYVITVSARDAEGNVTRQTLTVTIADLDDNGGISFAPAGSAGNDLEAGETEGETAVLPLQLTSRPTADVIITIADDAQCSFSPSTITISPADWDRLVNVTVSAKDDSAIEDSQSCTPVLTVRSADPAYDGLIVTDVPTITIVDNDAAPMIQGPSDGPGAARSEETIPSGQDFVHKFTVPNGINGRWLLPAVSGSTDRPAFVIDAETGVLAFRNPPLYIPNGDNEYYVVVRFDAGDGNYTDQLVKIIITDTAKQALDRNRGDIEQIISDLEVSRLRDQQRSLHAMGTAARDRLADCATEDRDEALPVEDEDQPRCNVDRNDVSRSVTTVGNTVTAESATTSVRHFEGYRKVVEADVRASGEGGIDTLSFNGRIALENTSHENALYGMFAGANFMGGTISRGLSGDSRSFTVSFGGYAVNELRKDLYSTAYLSFGVGQNMLDLSTTDFTVAADYGTRELHAGWSLAGLIERGDWEIWPELNIQVSRSWTSSIDVTGSIPGDSATQTWKGLATGLARAELLTDFRRDISLGAGAPWEFNVQPGLVCESIDAVKDSSGCGYKLALGLDHMSVDESRRFSLGFETEEVDDVRRNSGSITYEVKF